MKTPLFILLALLFTGYADALSELVPPHNFLAVTDSVLWMDCKPMENAHALQETYVESEKANEDIKQAKNSLVIASLMYAVQNSLLATSGPVIYPLASNQCAAHSINALRRSLSALSIVAQDTDEALTSLEFEIGHNFTGPGAEQLVIEEEALEGQGELGELMQRVARSTAQGRNTNNVRSAYNAASLVIGKNGAVEEVENFRRTVEKSLEALKTLEEELEAQLSEEVEETENNLKQLRQHDVEKLGLFELSAMEIPHEELVVSEVQSTSPAAMLGESEALLANAKNLEKSRRFYKSRGRTAKRIEALTRAIQEAQKAKTAAQRSWEETTRLVRQLEAQARSEAEEALQIERPIGRKMAEESITKFNPSDKYGERALQLNGLIYTLSRLKKTYDGEVDEGEKLGLKIELRELEELAKEAEKKGVSGAREIAASTKEMHGLIDEVRDSAGLVSLELQKKQSEETLINMVEERFGYLRDLYNQAVEAEKQSLLNSEEKTSMEKLREAFTGKGQLAQNIDKVNEFEDILSKIAGKEIKTTELHLRQGQEQETHSVEEIDVNTMLAELEEIEKKGQSAFHTEGKTRKSLEQKQFEDALKKAKASAKQIAKNPSPQEAEKLDGYMQEMNSALQEIERRAALEIAAAEQRGGAVANAQEQWSRGLYAEAMNNAEGENQKTNQERTEAITGRAASEDPKLWAIGITLVIILIGAAYLIYVKKNQQEDEVI